MSLPRRWIVLPHTSAAGSFADIYEAPQGVSYDRAAKGLQDATASIWMLLYTSEAALEPPQGTT